MDNTLMKATSSAKNEDSCDNFAFYGNGRVVSQSSECVMMVCVFSLHFLPFSGPESLEGNQIVLYRISSGHCFSTKNGILAVTSAYRRYIYTYWGDYGLILGVVSNFVVFFDENWRLIDRCGNFSFFWPEFYKYRDLLSGWSFLRFFRMC